MNKIITPEERKKWILEHRDLYIGESAKIVVEESREKVKKEFKEITGMEYSVENLRKWQKEHNIPFGRTFEEVYDDLYSKQSDINTYLNKETLIYSKQSNSKEEINSVDLSEALNEIRFDHQKEINLFLFLKNGKIIDKYLKEGIIFRVNVSKQDLLNIINKARKLDADVYNVHNHPTSFVAHPSEEDFKAAKYFKGLLEYFDVRFLDWGVVTEWDYYSNKQKENDGLIEPHR